MHYVSLGRTGLKVSDVCLGTMTFGMQSDLETSFAIMDVADNHGVIFVDTSDAYPLGGGEKLAGVTETIVGKWMSVRQARSRVVLATKCFGRTGPGPNDAGLNRKHVIQACDDSLRRLQTDYIDLYQLHHPDPTSPLDETLRAMDDLVRAGKVRYIGVSNHAAWQLALTLGMSERRGWARFDSAQPRYNLLTRDIEAELLPLCLAQGIGVLSYNPLGAGILTGKYESTQDLRPNTRFTIPGAGQNYQRRYWNAGIFAVVDDLKRFFAPRDKSLTHVALAWVLSNSAVSSAIVGASRPEQLEDSLKGATMRLDKDELAACDDAWYKLPRERDAQQAVLR